jgi:hypothetical protein
MAYKAIVVKLTNVRKHANADRLQVATVCGNQVVVGLDAEDGNLGVFFDVDGQLSEEFCRMNNLFRDKTKNINPEQSGMFDENRRVRAQKFRGEKSEGFFVPLSHFNYIDISINDADLVEGFEFDTLGGKAICNKYVSKQTVARQLSVGKTSKKKQSIMFKEHFDTAHFGRNVHKIENGDLVILTEKVHGTSQRVGHVQMIKPKTWWQKLFRLEATKYWEHVIGTRRVVLDNDKINKDEGWHKSSFRVQASEPFLGQLHKGETVFYEVVGWEGTGASIMGTHSNTKLKDHLDKEAYKNFITQFGDNTTFSYGCQPGEHKIFVYRITMTNEDGISVDYSWEHVVERCKELGVNTVPELGRWFWDGEESVKAVEIDSEGKSTLDNHIMEGSCVRIDRGATPLVLKQKNFEFKVLEGIIKDSGIVDAEEAA